MRGSEEASEETAEPPSGRGMRGEDRRENGRKHFSTLTSCRIDAAMTLNSLESWKVHPVTRNAIAHSLRRESFKK
ncbi:hypothetical protein E2C01_025291 [Portunus trituberculatus]|uniref:Uncharacterized protein n=1 Tax=Portunus trituberculatus TaxID=210409 RepID=A0A5B7EFD6_PORTR|nr:hypothetical protein [Portunus trituberculatus]